MRREGDFEVRSLGECLISTPMLDVEFADDECPVIYDMDLASIKNYLASESSPPCFEQAGPRRKIYFDPSKLKCGIVTCGGICPGINDVVRAIVLCLFHHYGVKTVFGFRYGYEGLSPTYRHAPMELSPEVVRDIHHMGGTILGSSRGPQNISAMVDTLERMNVGILFAIGGDGTLRGAHEIFKEISRRRLKIGVIGIPKTIDNDISYMHKSFGFDTAVAASRDAIYGAHVEAVGAGNGIGLVKLMGRHSGYIAANATLSNSEVNFCLVPEVRFTVKAFLSALKERLERRGHAVVVVAEGAGQELTGAGSESDASGNMRLGDIGAFLRDRIHEYFAACGLDINLKYIDPSYIIRSLPASPSDSVFCLLLGHNAVHAGMAGRADMVVGYWNGRYTHVPIPLAVSKRKQIDPNGRLWSSVLASTGQPRTMM